MGQFIWFHPVASMDAISVTANPAGIPTHSLKLAEIRRAYRALSARWQRSYIS